MKELPKYDTETWNQQMLLEKMVPVDLLDAVTTIFQFVKNAISTKYSKAKHNKVKYDSVPFNFFGWLISHA